MTSIIFISLFKTQTNESSKITKIQIPEKHVLAIEKEERAQKEIGTLKKYNFYFSYKNNVIYNNNNKKNILVMDMLVLCVCVCKSV